MPNNNEINPLTGLPVGTKIDAKDIKLPSSITGNIGSATQDELLTTEPMSKYTDRGIDVVPNTNLREKLADSQGVLEQAKNAVVGGTLSGLATVVQDFSYVPQLFSSHWEENAVSDAMIRAKEGIDEELPIYTKTDGMFDWNDGAFVWKALKATIDTGIGFGLPGGVIAEGLGTLGKVAKLEQGIQKLGVLARASKLEALGNLLYKSPTVYKAAMSLGSGYIMNRMEGTMMGVELYNKSMKEMEGDIASGKITQADAERVASQKADEFRNWNTMFAITDAIGVHGIIKGEGFTRNIKNKGWGLTEMSMENPILQAVKEGGEEIGQNIIQSEKEYETYRDLGLKGKANALSNKQNLAGRILDFGTSQQALYEGMLGLVGGYPQHVLSTAASGGYTSKARQEKEDYYNAQQKTIADAEAYLKGFNDINLNYSQLKAEALKKGDVKAAEALDKMNFTNQVVKAFSTGTTESFERNLDDIINLTPDKAKERGYGPDYSSKAQSLKKEMLTLEADWINTSHYINHEEVFQAKQTAKINQELYNNELEKSNSKANAVNNEASRLIQKYNNRITKEKGHDILGLSFDLEHIDNPNLSSELLKPYYNEFVNELKGTPAYDDYFSHKITELKQTEDALDEINNHYKTITSSKYQEAVQNLSETIKEKKKEAEAKTKKEEAKAKHKEVVAKVKEKVAAVVTPKAAVEETPVTTPDLNTPISLGNIQQEEETAPTTSNPSETEVTPQDNNTSSKEELEAKKADIERRRPTSYIRDSKDKKSPLETFRNEAKREWDGVSVITGDRMKNLYVGIQLFVEAYPEHKDLLDKFIKKENGTIGITNNNLSFVLNTLKKQGVTTESELGVKINAKYDAELKALESTELTPAEETVVVQTDAQQEEVTSNEISQQEYTDDTNDDVEETNIATENLVEKENLEEEEYFKSEFGSNILAYLSRLYNGFTSREDIDNLLNKELKDKSILDPNKFQPGTKITLQVKNNDASDMYVPGTKDKTTWGEYKIAHPEIKVGTEAYNNLVPIVILDTNGNEIADLHTTDWIRSENIFGDVQEDSLRLSKIRKHILANGGKLDSIITRKTNGKLFKLINGAKETIAKAFPDKNLHIVYSKKGELKNVPTKVAEATNMQFVKDGITYIVVPVNKNSYIPLPLQQKKVSTEIAQSISTAISVWYKSKGVASNLDSDSKVIAEAIYNETGLNITQNEDLRKYVTLFINSYDIPAEIEAKIPKDSKDSKLKIYLEGTSVKSTTHLLSVTGNTIDFGTGAKFTGSLSHATPENVANDLLSKLTSHIENMYLHINHSLLTKDNVKMPVINSDGTLSDINNNGSYKDFVRNNTETKYLSHNIGTEENPKYVYTIQPVIEYDTSFVDDTNTRINNELQAERNGDKTEITKANENIAKVINLLTNEEVNVNENKFDEDFLPLTQNQIDYVLKSVTILQSDKAKQVFDKGKKANWDLNKILTELQIPREQKELILNLGSTDREQIALELASKYSFVVEINTAKEKTIGNDNSTYTTDGVQYVKFGENDYRKRTLNSNFEKITKEEFEKNQSKPTQHYSNLTVNEDFYKNNPDWEYKEQRITTPLITPSIKGHAQFAEANDIGWFRAWYNKKTGEVHVLEVQSDLFQKGRDRKSLIKDKREFSDKDKGDYSSYIYEISKIHESWGGGYKLSYWNVQPNGEKNNKLDELEFKTKKEAEDKIIEFKSYKNNSYKDKENQFLQLLNKDNNWVTFFVKSIIQDSAKKGYEKVLFPTGNTASKVEGHTTLEEFKKQKEDRIKELENKKAKLDSTWMVSEMYDTFGYDDVEFSNEKDAQEYVNKNTTSSKILVVTKLKSEQESINTEIAQLKQELERVEGPEGFGALRPIYNFYENTVANILKKTYPVNQVTDEYGNTWNEVTLDRNNYSIDLLPLTDEQSSNVVNSFKNTILVPGLTANQQQEIVNDIAYLLQREVLEANGKTVNGRDVHAKYKAYLESLLAITTGKRKEVIQAVIDNYKSIENISYKYFSKLQGVQFKENVDNLFNKDEENTKVNVEEETDISNETESNLEKTTFEDSSLTQNYKNTISSRLKKFLSFIKTGEKNFVYSPQFVPFDEVYNTLKQVLSGERPDFDGMIKELEKNVISKPWLQDVVTQLNAAPGETKNDFVSAMTSHTVNMTFLMWQKDANDNYKLTPYSSNSVSISNMVVDNWYETGKLASVVIDKEGELVYNPEVVSRYNVAVQNLKDKKLEDITVTDVANTLAIVGIELHPEALKTFLSKGLSGQSFKSHLISKTGLFANLSNKLASTNDIVTDNYLGDKSITKLAYLEAKFNKNVTDGSFKSGVKSISAHTLNKHITNQVRELKNNRKLVTDMLSISFSKDSSLLKGLVFTEVNEDVKNEAEKVTGSREVTVNKQGVVIASDGQVLYNKDSYFYQNFNFDYLGLEAIKEYGKSSKEGSELKNLSAAEHELIKIGLFMKSSLTQDSKGNRVAQMFYPTMSDKTTMINITTLLHNVTYGLDGTLSNKTVDALFDALVLPEYNRMVNYKTSKNIKGYDKGHSLFYFLPQLNDRKELFHADGTIKDLSSDKDALIIIKNEIRNTIEELVKGKLAEWETYKFTKDNYLDADYMKNTAKKNIKNAATDYVVNYLIHNSNMFQSFIGDPALYFKSSSDDNMTKVEDTFINIGKRLAGDIAPGYEINNSYKDTFKTAILADRKSTSESIKYLVKVLDNKTITDKEIADYEKMSKDDKKTFLKKYPNTEGYFQIEAGDAQEYTTLREHLKVMYGLGKITEKEFNRINTLADEGKDLSDADLAVILQPMKPVYVANKIELYNDVNRRIYIKSSSFPLVPQLTRGLQIDNLRVAMEHPTTGVDRVSFGTAAKVGAPNNQLNIFDDKGDFKDVIDFAETEVLTLSRSGFRIQQEVPYDKEKINVGTQERKLLFVNLLNTPGFNYKEHKNISGKELQKIYTDKYHTLFKLQHKSLMEELEFNEATGKVNTSKLQKLLKKEAVERDFPVNDILGLELDRNGEFRIPLWLLPSTSRYESLLNAIVDNRVRKMKFNGGSFILGSEEGFKAKPTIVTGDNAQNKIDELSSDIVFTDSWTGKLKGTTEHGMTQALIPFKFRDSNGDLLDISKYTSKDKKNGKLMLDTTKLPKDLLKIFGFRIPTQGLNSMAQIEIVGFLPVSAGDLIITSKDFTKQMGSDFDVDKLYSYIYSHYTDSFGDVHKITNENIEKLINLSKSKTNKKEELSEKDITKLREKFEMLALHNEILDIHHAVLENTHDDVRKQMLSPLGFGDLKDGKDLANLIASWKKVRSGTQNFNGLSDSYQKQKFLNATDGKGGTGVFSLDSVFNSLVQGKELQYLIPDKDGFNTFSVKFGTLESTGELSSPKTLDGKKYKSDVIAAYQSASVDNEKEQILDKLNINSNTYDVIRILAQLGFDEETISAFTNQDIIVDFVKEIKLQKSSLYGYQPDLEATIIQELTKKYTEGIDATSESFINATIAKKNISTSELMSYIQNGKVNDNFGYAAAQIATLNKFKQLTEYGKTLKRIQSAINTDSAGLGKSLFASIAKEDSVRNLQNTPIRNAEKLIGNYTVINGKLEIEPTTINGFATVYGLFTNNSLWSKYFPYGHENIANIVTEINKVTSDKEMDTAQKEEVYKNVFGAVKSYLFTRKDLGVFEGDLKARREWLFKNLGKKINEFKINKVKLFQTNPFLNKLTTETDLKSGLKILKYNAVSLESFFEDSIYGGFLDLIQKNTEIADGYTTRQLADDFVQYAYLSGGKQQAVDFIRYIPIEYLNQLPFANKLRTLNFDDTNVLDNIQRNDKTPYYQVSEFVKQYVQHNSRKAPEFPATTKVEYLNKEKTQFTVAKDAITLSKMPTFVNFNEKLWQFNGQEYIQISKLGGKYQIGEYDANSRGITSIVNKQNPKQLVVTTKVDGSNSVIENTAKKPYEDVIVARNNKYKLNSGDITAVLDAITTNSTNPAYKRLAQEYLDVISKLGYKITIEANGVNAFGRTSYKDGNAHIQINNTNIIDSVEFLEKTILHETTHALTKYLIRANPDTLTVQQKEIVDKLDKFRTIFKTKVGSNAVEAIERKVKNKESLTEYERNILYPGINLEEFTAAAMENEEFQKYLAKEIWQGDKTMLDKFFELMRDLMKSLGIKPGEDLNKYIYSDVLNLIKSQVKQEVIEQPIQNKEGIDFVFENNPELANSVYEALGFNNLITPNDKIVFGHPTIGKTFLKEKGINNFISFDDDFAEEINNFVNAHKGSLDKYQYKQSKPKEYIDFSLSLYDKAKAQAKKEGKILFTSSNIIFGNRINDFDKVINLEREEFFKRIGERKTTYDIVAWKDQIDNLISKVDPNKVINTRLYLSDLLKNTTIKPTDKIIWGHPAIGKSYAAKKVKMIDFDSYKLGINRKYNLYIAPGLSDTELRTDDKTREARENWRYESEENQALWNQFIRDSWQQAKKDAKEQGAILFASDLLVLREFGNEVDKALTMPDELFFERSKQRNNFIEGELGTKVWKGNLNRAVNNFKEKFGEDKVISTEKYLSDLFITPQQKQEAQTKFQEYVDATGRQDIEGFKKFVEQPINKEIKPNEIYSQLGNKTVTGNVVIKGVYQQEGIEYAKSISGVFSLRVNNSNKHFGNPFSSVKSEIDKGLIATTSTKESVKKYIDWVINSQEERAVWIREQLKSGILKGKPIVYYKELGEPSHATALDYLINKYDWNKNQPTEIKPKIDISNSTKKSPYFEKDKRKFASANKLIARGSANSSSEAYRIAVGNKANTGVYDINDIVAISVEGNRAGRIKPDYKELEKAVEANVTFITDNTLDRNRDYNIGEREIGEYLESKGYSENGDGIWTKPKIDSSKKIEENALKQIEKDFQTYNDHPDVDYYTKGYVGKVVDETLTDLCAVTSNICISFLHSKGINVLYKPFHIYPTLKIANFKGDFVNHKVAISYINDKVYIFDMPQNEYITLNKKGEAILGEFKPRFIEVTPENMQKYYGIDKESYINTFEKFKVGGFEPFFLGAPKNTYVNFQESIINYFKEGSPVWSVSDYSKYMKDKSIKPTYTFKTQEQPIVEETKVIPLTSNFDRKSVENDKNYIYLFTDNAKRTSGSNSIKKDGMYAIVYNKDAKYPTMTQAVVRGLDNAYPITTMVDDNRTQWTDDKFEEYKNIIDLEIDHIKGDLQSGEFKGIKFSAQMPFGQGKISNMKQSAPKIWNYLNEKLAEIGINNTGTTPKVINKSTEIKPKIDSSKKINIYAGTNENAELSNFAHRPFEIGGMFYDNVESAFQHAKLAFSDMITEQPLEIQSAKWNTLSGAKAKALGRKFVGLDTKEWDKQSSSIMKTLLTESFKQNINALETLRGTGSAELTHTQDKGKWGTEFPKLLMEVRDELKEGTRGEEPGFEDIIEKDYDFKYFGTTYEIVTTNGIATDVPSLKQSASETNTKFQERKQKILDAYNENKDVDKQNGRKFRNLTINEEFHTVEKAPAVEKSESEKKSFTYKGRTIETAFELTDGQSNALKNLIDFSSNSSTTKAITLQGPAGTGKTATIGYLQKYLGGDSKLIYLAPTHAATAELAFATVKTGNKSLPLTAASGFRKGINKVTGEEEAVMTKKLLDRLSYGNNILVIDEVSMLNSKDYALILETIKNKPNIKLVFMGDILQIPEVNTSNPDKKQVSSAFTEYAQVILSEVKRTSSNSILQILTNLRKYTNSLIPKVKNTEQVQYVDDNGFDQLIVETFKKDSENTVLISYTNAGVKATNHKIREVLGRTGDLKKDDIITGYLGYSSKQIEKGNIANSIRFKVEDVEKDDSEYIIRASSQKLKSLREQGVSGVPPTFTGIYLQLSTTDAFTFDELTEADFAKNNIKLSEKMSELYKAKQAALKNPRMWSSYYDLQTSIGAYLASVNLGDDYIYNPKTDTMEKYNKLTHSKIDADLKIEKGVDFGHAITIHKSQGATFKNVFFDTATLPKGNSSKLYKGDDLISSEKHALIYVAMSRASDLLVVRASDSSLFYDVLERKNMPEITPQKEVKPDIEETLEDFLPLNNKFTKNTSELTKKVLSLFDKPSTIDNDNFKKKCK